MDRLAIGNYAYSSWSLRGWLLYDAFDIPRRVDYAKMRTPEFTALTEAFFPTQLVPAVIADSESSAPYPIWDSLAIAESLAERHPDRSFWPKDTRARAIARSVTAEMHSGFTALRSACPMNLHQQFEDFDVSDNVRADLERLETLWQLAGDYASGDNPWLFGDYTIADAFFAPVAMRVIAYQLPVSERARQYCDQHLAHHAFRRWRAMAIVENTYVDRYAMPNRANPFPLAHVIEARAVTGKTPENQACPYSGRDVSDDSLAEIDGHIVGFCNPFCRDKSVADPEVWPALQKLIGR